MTVYKKEQIPDRFHYKHNIKIQPILAVADKGWEIVRNKTEGFLSKYSVLYSILLYLPRQGPYLVFSLLVSTTNVHLEFFF